jgi:hypothetical protein
LFVDEHRSTFHMTYTSIQPLGRSGLRAAAQAVGGTRSEAMA